MDTILLELDNIAAGDASSNAQKSARPSSPLRPNNKYCPEPSRPQPKPAPSRHLSASRNNWQTYRNVPRQNTHGLTSSSPVAVKLPTTVEKIMEVATKSEMEIDEDVEIVDQRSSSPLKPNEKYIAPHRPAAVAHVAPRRVVNQLQQMTQPQQQKQATRSVSPVSSTRLPSGMPPNRSALSPPLRRSSTPTARQERPPQPIPYPSSYTPPIPPSAPNSGYGRQWTPQDQWVGWTGGGVQPMQQLHPMSQMYPPNYAAYYHNPYGANYQPYYGGGYGGTPDYGSYYNHPIATKQESMDEGYEEDDRERMSDTPPTPPETRGHERITKNARRRLKKDEERRELEEERKRLNEEKEQFEREKKETAEKARIEEDRKRREMRARGQMASFSSAAKLKKEEVDDKKVTMSIKEVESLRAECEARGLKKALDEQRRREELSRVKMEMKEMMREPEPMEFEESDAIESMQPAHSTTSSTHLASPKLLRIKKEAADSKAVVVAAAAAQAAAAVGVQGDDDDEIEVLKTIKGRERNRDHRDAVEGPENRGGVEILKRAVVGVKKEAREEGENEKEEEEEKKKSEEEDDELEILPTPVKTPPEVFTLSDDEGDEQPCCSSWTTVAARTVKVEEKEEDRIREEELYVLYKKETKESIFAPSKVKKKKQKEETTEKHEKPKFDQRKVKKEKEKEETAEKHEVQLRKVKEEPIEKIQNAVRKTFKKEKNTEVPRDEVKKSVTVPSQGRDTVDRKPKKTTVSPDRQGRDTVPRNLKNATVSSDRQGRDTVDSQPLPDYDEEEGGAKITVQQPQPERNDASSGVEPSPAPVDEMAVIEALQRARRILSDTDQPSVQPQQQLQQLHALQALRLLRPQLQPLQALQLLQQTNRPQQPYDDSDAPFAMPQDEFLLLLKSERRKREQWWRFDEEKEMMEQEAVICTKRRMIEMEEEEDEKENE